MNPNIDFIGRGGGFSGEVASAFANSGRLDVLMMKPYWDYDEEEGQWKPYLSIFKGGDRMNANNYVKIQTNAATLRRDEWKLLDEAVMKVARERLVGIDDLRSHNLVYKLGNPMGTEILEWHDVDESMEAIMTMDAVTRSRGDRPTFQYNYIPIPIIHVDYEINARALAASRNLGNPLDTIAAEQAARRVIEYQEDMLFTDTSYSYGEKDSRSRNSIYSYLNFPDRNEVALSLAWDNNTKTGSQILTDVLNMVKASIAKNHRGPWMMYIPTDYQTAIDKDYDTTTPGTTIRERILKVTGIEGIKTADRLPDDTVLLVEMKSDTVRLIDGIPLQNVQWGTEGNFITKYKVLTIQVPQIRSDRNGQCGIVQLAA
jgi:hypothetical protein